MLQGAVIGDIMTTTDGVLLRLPGSRFGDRVFFCRDGHRHWVTDARWLSDYGFRWPDDIRDVPSGVSPRPQCCQAPITGRACQSASHGRA